MELLPLLQTSPCVITAPIVPHHGAGHHLTWPNALPVWMLPGPLQQRDLHPHNNKNSTAGSWRVSALLSIPVTLCNHTQHVYLLCFSMKRHELRNNSSNLQASPPPTLLWDP